LRLHQKIRHRPFTEIAGEILDDKYCRAQASPASAVRPAQYSEEGDWNNINMIMKPDAVHTYRKPHMIQHGLGNDAQMRVADINDVEKGTIEAFCVETNRFGNRVLDPVMNQRWHNNIYNMKSHDCKWISRIF
jgi:hypothetical protein